MRLSPFKIEEYYAKHEFSAKYMLSSSDSQTRSVAEILNLEPDARARFEAIQLGYTETIGGFDLRRAISSIYSTTQPDQVLVLSNAEEGIFVLYNALLAAGDHAIIETPCFNSALEVAKATGADVSEWQLHFDDNWQHDLAALEKLIRPNTKLMYICTPHNPIGRVMPRAIFEALIDLAASRQIIIFCDEVFRELEHDPKNRLPAISDAYEHGVSLGSVSKSYGLPGLRLGWYATRDQAIFTKALAFKNYTTICASAPSEFLAALALRHRQVLLQRNLEIVQRNLPLLEAFFTRYSSLFSYVAPTGSPMVFPKVHLPNVEAFCERVVQEISVLLLPGSTYDQPHHARFGFGRSNLPEALGLLEAFVQKGDF